MSRVPPAGPRARRAVRSVCRQEAHRRSPQDGPLNAEETQTKEKVLAVLAFLFRRRRMPDMSLPSDSHRDDRQKWPRLSEDQQRQLVYLEATDGEVRHIYWDHPLIEEFVVGEIPQVIPVHQKLDLGKGTCMMEFDHIRMLVGTDGSMVPLPKIKRVS